MVRPCALERRSARVAECPRGAAAPAAARRGFSFTGFLFYSHLLQRCRGSPRRVLGNARLGTSALCLGFSSRRRSPCPPRRKAPRAFTRAESRPGGGGRGERGAGGRPAAQPPPWARGGDGRGRRRRETWRERGPDGPELLAGGGRSAGTLLVPLGDRRIQLALAALWPPFSCFCVVQGTSSARGGGGSGCSASTSAHLLCFQSGRLRGEARPGRPGAAAACARRSSWGGRAARRGAGSPGGAGGGDGQQPSRRRQRRTDGGASGPPARPSVVRCLPDTMALAERVQDFVCTCFTSCFSCRSECRDLSSADLALRAE
ncbi:uncharacterized protein WM277_020500 isoform 1-T1 [Molossus nigricans]